MNWNWFPLDAAGAIQSRMHRRLMLDECKISQDQKEKSRQRQATAAAKIVYILRGE